MTSLILIIIGMLVGWNLPQPIWAKTLQDKAVEMLRQKDILK
jgi:hypothetical protein